jgi:hypothetical protein
VSNHAEARTPARRAAPVIEPNAVFTLDSLKQALGLAKGCLPREIRLGRLRTARRGGRYFLLGKWVLEWIEGGELRRSKRSAGEDNKEDARR